MKLQSKYLVIFSTLIVLTVALFKVSTSHATCQDADYAIAKSFVDDSDAQEKVVYVLGKCHEMGLPAILAAVPMVESQYKSTAVSTKGAAGEWQFMPALAKEYGLTSDERCNFKLETAAALANLKKLHDRFGNWSLAFAAYNAGPHSVAKALAKNPNTQDVNNLALPDETKKYVVKIMNYNKLIQRA